MEFFSAPTAEEAVSGQVLVLDPSREREEAIRALLPSLNTLLHGAPLRDPQHPQLKLVVHTGQQGRQGGL